MLSLVYSVSDTLRLFATILETKTAFESKDTRTHYNRDEWSQTVDQIDIHRGNLSLKGVYLGHYSANYHCLTNITIRHAAFFETDLKCCDIFYRLKCKD